MTPESTTPTSAAAPPRDGSLDPPIDPALVARLRAGPSEAELSGSSPQPACAEAGEPADISLDGAAHESLPARPARAGVLRHRHYRNVLLAQFVSNCGNWMEMVGLQMFVANWTHSLKWLGYLGAAQLTPILVLGTLGGLVADRVDRRRLLMVTQLLLMLAAAMVAVVARMSWTVGDMTPIHLLTILGGLQGVIMAFNMPAWQVLTPHLVPRSELTAAITVNGIQFNLARVIGPALAGLIAGSFGLFTLFVINTASFLVVVASVALTPPNPPPPHDGKHPWRQIRDAIAFLAGNPGPLAVFLATVVMSLFAAPLVRFLSLFVIDVYGYTDNQGDLGVVGLLLAVQGVGAVIGGLCLRILPRWYPKHHLIPVAILGNGLFITLFALSRSPWLGFPLMLVIGFFWIWAFNQSWAALQHLAPDAMRGRVMALAGVASFGATAVGSVAGGYVGEFLHQHNWVSKAASTQISIASLSLLLLGAGVVMLLFRTPEVDGLPRSPPGGRSRPSRNLLKAIIAAEHRP